MHSETSWVIARAMLFFAASFTVHSTAFSQQVAEVTLPEWIFETGFEPRSRISIDGDLAALLTAPGQFHDFTVSVDDENGSPLPDQPVRWQLGESDDITLEVTGPRSARVTATSFSVGSTSIRVSTAEDAAQGQIILAQLQPNVVKIANDSVIDVTRDGFDVSNVALARSPQSEALQVDDIVLSGDSQGVMARITSVDVQSDRVVLDTEQASLRDAFAQLNYDATSEPLLVDASYSAKREFAAGSKGIVECELDGSGPSNGVQFNGPDIDVTFLTFANGRIVLSETSTDVDDFLLQLSVRPKITMRSGSIDFFSSLGNVELTCQISLPALEGRPLPLGPIVAVVPGIEPRVGFKVAAKSVGPGLTLTGPIETGLAPTVGGIRYTPSEGWQSTSSVRYQSIETTPTRLTARPTVEVSTDIKPFGAAAMQLGFNVVKVARVIDVKFLDVEAGVNTNFSLSLPVDPDTPGYTGPEWITTAEVAGELKGELSGGVLGPVLEAVGIDTSFDLGVQLFEFREVLAQSPKLLLNTDCDAPCLVPPLSPVALTASGDRPLSGVLSLLELSETGALQLFDASGYNNGAAFSLVAPAQTRDSLTLYPQLVADETSEILPYAAVENPMQIISSDVIRHRAGTIVARATSSGRCLDQGFQIIDEFDARDELSEPLGLGGEWTRSASIEQTIAGGASLRASAVAIGSFLPVAESSFQLRDMLAVEASIVSTGAPGCRGSSFSDDFKTTALTALVRDFDVQIPVAYSIQVICEATANSVGTLLTARIDGNETSYRCNEEGDTKGQSLVILEGETSGPTIVTTNFELAGVNAADFSSAVPDATSAQFELGLTLTPLQ